MKYFLIVRIVKLFEEIVMNCFVTTIRLKSVQELLTCEKKIFEQCDRMQIIQNTDKLEYN